MDSPGDLVPCEDFPTCGVAQFQNRQYSKNAKQQDSYFIVEDLGAIFSVHPGSAHQAALYGVADGHGEFGEVSANFIRRNLPAQLAKSPHFAAGHLGDALRDAFSRTELLQQTANLPLWASGACVSAAVVSPAHIVVANCGDCRCVLADGGTARDLSNDHNVESATTEELRRILDCGGTIMPDKRVTIPGAPGRLAATRSLGDYWAKPQGPPERHVISGLPELRVVQRHPGQQYLILASDGIFGFMSSQDVVALCLSVLGQAAPSAPLSRLAHTVVGAAVSTGRSDDNCTCLVVDLARVEASFAPAHAVGSSAGLGKAGRPVADAGQNGLVAVGAHRPFAQPPALQSQSIPALRLAVPDPSKDESDAISLSSLVAPDEVCWCPWCWRMSQDGSPESVVLGSFDKWRLHMHEQHFDKLGGAYGPDEVVPCYWCCRPCATKEGQKKPTNRLPFWGSHERVCQDNPNKPALPGCAHSAAGSTCSGHAWQGLRAVGPPGGRHQTLWQDEGRRAPTEDWHSAVTSLSSLEARRSGPRSEVAAPARPPRRRAL